MCDSCNIDTFKRSLTGYSWIKFDKISTSYLKNTIEHYLIGILILEVNLNIVGIYVT